MTAKKTAMARNDETSGAKTPDTMEKRDAIMKNEYVAPIAQKKAAYPQLLR